MHRAASQPINSAEVAKALICGLLGGLKSHTLWKVRLQARCPIFSPNPALNERLFLGPAKSNMIRAFTHIRQRGGNDGVSSRRPSLGGLQLPGPVPVLDRRGPG